MNTAIIYTYQKYPETLTYQLKTTYSTEKQLAVESQMIILSISADAWLSYIKRSNDLDDSHVFKYACQTVSGTSGSMV